MMRSQRSRSRVWWTRAAEQAAAVEGASGDQHGTRFPDPVLYSGVDELPEQRVPVVVLGEVVEPLVQVGVLLRPRRSFLPDFALHPDLTRREDQADAFVRERPADHRLDAVWCEDVVGVEKLDEPSGREPNGPVMVPGLAEVLAARLDADAWIRVRPGDVERRVRGGVVADDELEIVPRLGERGLDRLADPLGGVVRRHADQDEGLGGGRQGASALARSAARSGSGRPSSTGASGTDRRSRTVGATSIARPPGTISEFPTPGPPRQSRTCGVCSPERANRRSRAGSETVPIRGDRTLLIAPCCLNRTIRSGRFGCTARRTRRRRGRPPPRPARRYRRPATPRARASAWRTPRRTRPRARSSRTAPVRGH
jgi:hypothetical protein